jgi:hypothetical protein
MAYLTGPLKYLGSFKDIRHYKLPGNDKIFAATKGFVTYSIYRDSPVFVENRKVNFEFTGQTKLASDIHQAMGDWSLGIVNRYFQGKMTSLLYDILVMDKEHLTGNRNIYLSKYKELLYQLEAYHYYKPLAEVFRCPYFVSEGPRNMVSVTVKGLYPLKQVKGPDKATHFKIYLSIGCVKDYIIDPRNNMYGSYEVVQGGHFRNETSSEWIPIDGSVMEDFTLSVTLPETHELTDSETVLRSFGIVYGRMTAEVVPLKKDRGSIVFLGAV